MLHTPELSEIDVHKLNFSEIGERIKAYRLVLGLTQNELAKLMGIRETIVSHIETGREYSSINNIWHFIRATGVSVKWILYGSGSFDDESDAEMPATVFHARGKGIRRTENRIASEAGQYEGEVFEFVLAVENYKRFNNKPFPTLSEIYELVKTLGYRQVERPIINPAKVLVNATDRI
jgi:transcriptional regulator with XRE-family HTH domain